MAYPADVTLLVTAVHFEKSITFDYRLHGIEKKRRFICMQGN